MPIEFETKKLSMETLGEYLAEVRKDLGLTLEEVSQKTGVYEKFIHYIETGNYNLLPPGVYVLGFLKKLAAVYNISCEALLEQYRKERGIVEHGAVEQVKHEKTWQARLKRLTITPKLITISASGLLGIVAFLYVAAQVFAINKTPNLTISEPQNDSVIAGTSVNVSGKTEAGMTVKINGDNIFVNPDGEFHTTIGVAPGQKELNIASTNKFGKTNSQIVALRVEQSTVAQAPVITDGGEIAGAQTKVPSELQVQLKFTKTTKIEVVKDGVDIPSETIPSGAVKDITASDKVIITTYDAGNTTVTLNGKPIGTLGKVGEKITIPFSKDSADLMGKTP